MTVEILSDDVLLEIFRHYLDLSPRHWSMLAHVCQRWRQIVFTSPHSLDLRLYFTYGTSALKILEYWPPFPLVLNYGGSPPMLRPPALDDEENIVAALKQSDRVRSISLTVTSSLVGKLSAISEPFAELEEMTLLSRDLQLVMASTFRWGSRLRTLHSTMITFPSFPELLLHSRDLVDLHLHDIPIAGYFSPEVYANALSGMTKLRSLSLHFFSSHPRRDYLGYPTSSGERIVLPSLSCFKYRGVGKYLDSLLSRIDTPSLQYIHIAYFTCQPTMDAAQLFQFISRTEMMNPPRRADILTSGRAISVSFTQSNAPTRFEVEVPCGQLDWQLSFMTQICNQLPPFLSCVEELLVNTTRSSISQNDLGSERWLELIRPFCEAKDIRVSRDFATDIPATEQLCTHLRDPFSMPCAISIYKSASPGTCPGCRWILSNPLPPNLPTLQW